MYQILKEMVHLCLSDDTICRYIYTMQSPTFQYARYSDWFFTYAEQQKKHIQAIGRACRNINSSNRKCIKSLDEILEMRQQFQEKCQIIKFEQKLAMETNNSSSNKKPKICMAGLKKEIIEHFPP